MTGCIYFKSRGPSGPRGEPPDTPGEEWCTKDHEFEVCQCLWNGKTSVGEEGHDCNVYGEGSGQNCPDFVDAEAYADERGDWLHQQKKDRELD